jgi:hypothetical protein
MTAKPFDSYTVLMDLYNAVAGISDNIFVTNRPTSVDEKMNDFIVVALPVRMRTQTYGYEHYVEKTTGRIILYVRDKTNGIPNMARMQSMIDATAKIFPINTENIGCYRPSVVDSGSDDNGFHTYIFQFSLIIK